MIAKRHSIIMPESDNLWDEIPGAAYMALGTRGMEQIDLHQCFNPACAGAMEKDVHPLDKVEETIPKVKEGMIERVKYRLRCDICKAEYFLVFDRHKSKPGESNTVPDRMVMEQVYATDLAGNSWGEIGWVQDHSF
jgi:hypothetical protein